jgi:hypothetical protein
MLWWPVYSNECRFGYHCRRRASDCCNLHRGSRNNLISHLLSNFILNPSMVASSRGWGVFIHGNGNHVARQENGSSWWGCLCDVCFASKKSSERDFLFPPERTYVLSYFIISFQHWVGSADDDINLFLVGGKNCSWQLHEGHDGRFAGLGSKIGSKPPPRYHWKALIKGFRLVK